MSDIDRRHAERLLRAAELDALVLVQPEAFRYAVGAPAGVATMWGRAGAAIALVPTDPDARLAAIASDHAAAAIRAASPAIDLRVHRIWIDGIDVGAAASLAEIDASYRRQGAVGPRPETFDRAAAFALLGDVLAERGLAGARIGVDLAFMPAADFHALRQALPHVAWADGSDVLRRLRAVKTPREILRLRRAAAAAEGGLTAMAAEIRPGAHLATLSAAWKAGAEATARAGGFGLSGHWDYISVGPDLADTAAVVTPGALIKADVGTLVEGYSSDGARSFSFGAPAPLAASVFAALSDAFAAGLDEIRPGNTFGAVHRAMAAAMAGAGLPRYDRGHFGHSVGGGVGIEEWPFFSRDNPEIIASDMVVALEAPFYGQGLGALMIEDQFLVTSTGVEPMMTLPRGLVDVAGRG